MGAALLRRSHAGLETLRMIRTERSQGKGFGSEVHKNPGISLRVWMTVVVPRWKK